MFAHEAVRNALLAGLPLAVAGGVVGYFAVQRGEVFAADALSHVAFTGAVLASAVAVDLRLGLFGATLAAALALAAFSRRAVVDDVAIGIVLAAILGVGVLALHLLASGRLGGQGTAAAATLFGSLFTLSRGEAALAAAVGGGVVVALAVLARPLLFASLQGELARARGVPIEALRFAFLVLLAVEVAAATQALGALLVLGLIAGTGGTVQRFAVSPYLALLGAGAIAAAALLAGVVLSYQLPPLPPASAVVLVIGSAHLLAVAL